jgi:hypothetical protein
MKDNDRKAIASLIIIALMVLAACIKTKMFSNLSVVLMALTFLWYEIFPIRKSKKLK